MQTESAAAGSERPSVHKGTLTGRRICLVSSSNVGSNPRLVKEADALHEAGAIVHVISVDSANLPEVQSRDAAVLKQAAWSSEQVDARTPLRRLGVKLQRLVCRKLYAAGCRINGIRLRAYNPLVFALASAARRTDADLFIAHNLAALPAAAIAASVRGAKLGFDAEDFHSGELQQGPGDSMLLELTQWIEQTYLPNCQHLTAASPGIAEAYASACRVREPVTVLNVFPLVLAPAKSTACGWAAASPSLYWFSQTIGPDRGLETAIAALSLARCRPTLYLQCSLSPGFEATISTLACSHRVSDRIVILPPCLPDELVHNAGRYDAGLSSELQMHVVNRRIALTNKLFTFLLAGIPVIASDTDAQTRLARATGEVIQIYSGNDPQDLARCIDNVMGDPQRLAQLRQQAWLLGHQRFNWDLESCKLVDAVSGCLVDSLQPVTGRD